MAWITLTSEHVKDRLAFDELNAIEATGGGDGDRLTGILAQVTSLVRAKVAACDDNSIGDAGTIPEECLHAAATLAKHDLRATLPSTGLDESDLRADEYRAAQDFYRKSQAVTSAFKTRMENQLEAGSLVATEETQFSNFDNERFS